MSVDPKPQSPPRPEAASADLRLDDPATLLEFAGRVTHQIRKPVAAAKAYAELLEDGLGGPLTETQVEFVDTIQRNLGALDDALADLYRLVRATCGSPRLADEAIELEELCIRVQDRVAGDYRAASTRLTLESPRRAVLERGDESELERALESLLRRVLEECAAGDEVRLRLEPDDEEIRIEVLDSTQPTGDEERELRTPLERGAAGVRLALYLARRCFVDHGGDLTVGPRPVRGRRWVASLPARVRGSVTEPVDRRRSRFQAVEGQ